MTGKWWDENEGKWVETNLQKEKEKLENIPEDDEDILGEARKGEEVAALSDEVATSGEVKETYYYDVLGVDPTAPTNKIRRQYYILAKQYHPDKVGPDDKEAAEKFKDVAEAYQVLSDDELRATYDKEGRDGLSADKTSVAEGIMKVDPALLFAFLFGSDQFSQYTGTLAMATTASLSNPSKVTLHIARTVQKRRCTRLAISLADKLSDWVNENYDLAKSCWTTEAQTLARASYGVDLLHVIGCAYSLAATQFLGSLDSGIGMPSITKWAKNKQASFKRSNKKKKGEIDLLRSGMTIAEINAKLQLALEQAKTDEEKEAIKDQVREELSEATLNVLWTTTVIDIANTLHETCQMVLFDLSVNKETRKSRAYGLKNLGAIFEDIQVPQTKSFIQKSGKTLYEEAAFAAMLETVAKKEAATFNASIKH